MRVTAMGRLKERFGLVGGSCFLIWLSYQMVKEVSVMDPSDDPGIIALMAACSFAIGVGLFWKFLQHLYYGYTPNWWV